MNPNLIPEYHLNGLILTDYPYAVEFDGDHGAPETVTEIIETMWADGDQVEVTRHGNRELTLVVYVEGADLAEMSTNEAALRDACRRRRGELTFIPGDGFGSSTVFDVFAASMRHARSAETETALLRRWELTIPAAPWVRPVDPVTIPALDVGTGTTATIDDCSSTSGWSTHPPGTLTSNGSQIEASWPLAVTTSAGTIVRTATVDFSSTRYLVADARVGATYGAVAPLWPSEPSLDLVIGTRIKPMSVTLLASGYKRYVYDTGGVLTSAIGFTVDAAPTTGAWSTEIVLDNISRTDMPPAVGEGQVSRVLEVNGTERTPASLRIEAADGTSPLGMTILHTSPADETGYNPALRRWRSSGNASTAEVATFTGSREALHPDPVICTVPATAMPEGGYLLAAALVTDAAETFTVWWTVDTLFDSTSMGSLSGSVSVTLAANKWTFVPLATVSLPTAMTNGGDIRVYLQRGGGSEDLWVDEAWLFRIDDDCALTVAEIDAANLWCDSPGIDSSVPRVRAGDSETSWSHPGAGLVAMGTHILSAPRTALYAASNLTGYPKTTGTFWDRFHSSVAT